MARKKHTSRRMSPSKSPGKSFPGSGRRLVAGSNSTVNSEFDDTMSTDLFIVHVCTFFTLALFS